MYQRKPVRGSVPAITPQSVADLTDEIKTTALAYFIAGKQKEIYRLVQLIREIRSEKRALATELVLCQRDNVTLRSLLVQPMPASGLDRPVHKSKESK